MRALAGSLIVVAAACLGVLGDPNKLTGPLLFAMASLGFLVIMMDFTDQPAKEEKP